MKRPKFPTVCPICGARRACIHYVRALPKDHWCDRCGPVNWLHWHGVLDADDPQYESIMARKRGQKPPNA